MSDLTIGLNLLWLRPGIVGGTETYATRLIDALVDHASDAVDVHAFASSEAIDAHRIHMGRIARTAAPGGSTAPLRRLVVERTWLRREQHRQQIDLMHHLGGTLPAGSLHPNVVTIHDLQPLDAPENFPLAKRRWLSSAIPNAVHAADVVTAPSDWVCASIIERFGVAPERVRTVSAYAPPPRAAAVTPSEQVIGLLRRGPVFLYPAMTITHKNHLMLFRAASVAFQSRPELQLV